MHRFVAPLLPKLAALLLFAGLISPAWSQAVATPYSYARTSGFTYQASGLLASESIEPGSAELCVVTSYTYDAYGNRAASTTTNCAGVAVSLARFEARSTDNAYAQHAFTLGSTTATIPAGECDHPIRWTAVHHRTRSAVHRIG